MSNSAFSGRPFSPVDAQMDLMRPHVVRGAAREPKSDTPQHTFILARPPAWTERAMCISNPESYTESVGLNAGEAAQRCKGCTVVAECLSAAMEEERGLSAGNRYTVRGGLSPRERAMLEFAERTCRRGHRDRWGTNKGSVTPICLECIAEDKRRDYHEQAKDPQYRERRSAALRQWRDERRVTCLECKAEMWSPHLERHVNSHARKEGVAA